MSTGRPRDPAAAVAGIVLLLLLTPGDAGVHAASDRHDEIDGNLRFLTPLARLQEGSPSRVMLAGTYAFVALDTGLAAYDLAAPDDPRRLDHLYLPSAALGLVVDGDHAFVANGEAGLAVVDLRDPSRLQLTSSLSLFGVLRAVAISGGVAYLAQSTELPSPVHSLVTVDVSDPRNPRQVGSLNLPSGPRAVAVLGSTVVVGLGSGASSATPGLVTIDAADPARPTLRAFLATGWTVNALAMEGTTVYLATGVRSAGALVTVDVGLPAAPVETSILRLADTAMDVALAPGRALVAARALGLLAFDRSDPAHPTPMQALPTGRDTVAVAALGDLAVLGERASIERAALAVVDSAPGAAVRARGCVDFAETTDVVLAAGLAYLLRRDALHLYEASGPIPVLLGTWRPPAADLSALSVSGALAAVTDGALVRLVDVQDPTGPIERGSARVQADVAIRPLLSGNTLHVLTGLGIESFDVSSPSAPAALGCYPSAAWPFALDLSGPLAYLAAGDSLEVLDLAVPASPRRVGSMRVAGDRLQGVAVLPPLAVLTGESNRLYVADVSDPAAPRLTSFLPGGPGFDVRLTGTQAVVSLAEKGVCVIDVSDPLLPVEIGLADVPGATYRIAVEGDRVALATGAAQAWLLDCGACRQGCRESRPAVTANSLRASREGGSVRLRWAVSGAGSCNVHRTAQPAELPALHALAVRLVGSTASAELLDSSPPGADPAGFYRVFARGSCSAASYPP